MNPTRCAPHSRNPRPSPATPLPAGVRARMRCPFPVAAGAGCHGEVTRTRPTLHSLGDSAVFGLDSPFDAVADGQLGARLATARGYKQRTPVGRGPVATGTRRRCRVKASALLLDPV
jgi:hypothetical protein